MKKHEILEHITIEKLIFGGSGLATAPDGRRIIISGGAIPDAIVDLRITKVKKNHLEAQILRTVKKSPLEQSIPSEWQLYGGCKWLPIPYTKQLEIKEQQIREAFYVLGPHIKDTEFHSIIASPESEHYRNKVEFSWGKYISDREGVHDEYRFGFHAPGQFDRIENCRYCVLADEEVNAIFRDIDRFARASGLPTYDPKRQDGFWRHLVVRKAKKTHEVMLIFSVNGIYEKKQELLFKNIITELTEKFPHIVSIFFLENTGKADIVQGNPVLLFGKSYITEELLGLHFDIQPKSFFQVNTLGAERLYSVVSSSPRKELSRSDGGLVAPLIGGDGDSQGGFVSETPIPLSATEQADIPLSQGGRILLDLYAGTGTIGILLAKYFSKVYSVELVASASEDGKKNAEKNSVTNVEFINAKVEDFAKEFADSKKTADTIVLDPPRDGLHPSAIPYILSFGAREIIYVSCNPATLVRDLTLLLVDDKYHLTDVTPVDMFPHTHHIETVVRLEKVIQ